MARFLLESNRRFCAIVRRQVQKSCQETAGRLFIEGGVVVITNEKVGNGLPISPGSNVNGRLQGESLFDSGVVREIGVFAISIARISH